METCGLLITHVHTPCTHPHLPQPSCWAWSVSLFFSVKIMLEPQQYFITLWWHVLFLPHCSRFFHLQLVFAAPGAAIEGLWNVHEGFASPDWWIKPKQTRCLKILSCCVKTLKPPFLTFSIAAFLLLLSFTLLGYLSYFYPSPLCVWYVYRKSAATYCQHSGTEHERKKQRGAAERRGSWRGRREEDLSSWPFPLLCKCQFFKGFLRGKLNCLSISLKKSQTELRTCCSNSQIGVTTFYLINLASARYPSISARPCGLKPFLK